jgi:hypothetical protein
VAEIALLHRREHDEHEVRRVERVHEVWRNAVGGAALVDSGLKSVFTSCRTFTPIQPQITSAWFV